MNTLTINCPICNYLLNNYYQNCYCCNNCQFYIHFNDDYSEIISLIIQITIDNKFYKYRWQNLPENCSIWECDDKYYNILAKTNNQIYNGYSPPLDLTHLKDSSLYIVDQLIKLRAFI